MARRSWRPTFAGALMVAALSASPAAAGDLSYVADEELEGELAAREADLERTRSRLRRVEAEAAAARDELDDARQALAEIESHLAARVAALYRFSRHGAGLRHLLDHDSGAAALRRIAVLQRLVVDGLERRRAAGLRIAQIEEHLGAVEEEWQTALELEVQLETARDELLVELRRRRTRMVDPPGS